LGLAGVRPCENETDYSTLPVMTGNEIVFTLVVVGLPLSGLGAGVLLLLDASRIRIHGAVAWSAFTLAAWPLAIPLYLHFRRMHMERLRALAEAEGKPLALPTAVLTRAETARIFAGLAVAGLGVVALILGLRRTGRVVAVTGVVVAASAARRIGARSY
jgi:hypothetical protein